MRTKLPRDLLLKCPLETRTAAATRSLDEAAKLKALSLLTVVVKSGVGSNLSTQVGS